MCVGGGGVSVCLSFCLSDCLSVCLCVCACVSILVKGLGRLRVGGGGGVFDENLSIKPSPKNVSTLAPVFDLSPNDELSDTLTSAASHHHSQCGLRPRWTI